MNAHALGTFFILCSMAVGCKDHDISKAKPVEEESVDSPDDTKPFSNDWGQWLSMDVTSKGQPIITFYDREQGGIGFGIGTMVGSNVTWSFEGVDGYPDASGLDAGDRGLYTSVVATPDGTIWTSFYDQGAKNLRYGKRHPTLKAWSTNIADMGDGPSPDAGRFSSIAIDASGNPIIAHHDHANGTLRLARWNGINFVGSVFDRGEPRTGDTGTSEPEAPANVGQFVKLKVINGTEYMAYYDAAHGDLKLAIGDFIDVVDSDGDVGLWPDFQVKDGVIHIMYQDKGQQRLKYARGVPGDWTITEVDRSPYTGADTATYFVGDDLRVVYFEGRYNDMKQAQYAAGVGAWANRVIARDGAVGFHNEVAKIGSDYFVASYNFTSRSVHFAKLD